MAKSTDSALALTGSASVPSGDAPITTRPGLPDRDVSAANIEDAYVRFIYYCNPALPPDADAGSLREAFSCPPKSGGKVFHPFTVYELVKRFYAKDIKTWTELTTLLGVQPPDLAKDESAQKVAQYGVRLKKWMNSMHVRAFFEYLMNIPNDYWTKIPSDPSPIACAVRDGVALEDDMALRALIPHIRPKRGRKRPDGDDSVSFPAQRPRISPPSAIDNQGQAQSWPAHHPMDSSAPTEGDAAPNGTAWRRNDLPTPLSRWPQSAVTPSSKGTFWDDALEPRSAVTPSRPRPSSHRRGAKNVSSAWKPGGLEAGAKQRGRPPVNRTPVEAPPSATQDWRMSQDAPPAESRFGEGPSSADHGQDRYQHADQAYSNGQDQMAPSTQASSMQQQHTDQTEGSRPPRPSISLQVPQHHGGPVRLATPPAPHVEPTSNGQHDHVNGQSAAGQPASNGWQRFAKEATDAYEQASNVPSNGCEGPENMPEYYFEKMEDRTNVDALVAYFVRSMADSEWLDIDGKPGEPGSVEESTAIVHSMLQNMYKTSTSPQAFLINLAALAGSMTLVTNRPKCIRMGEVDDTHVYKCDWEYRFGHVTGGFTMSQYVPRTMWTPKREGPDTTTGGTEQESPLTAEDWKRKYQALADEVDKRNRELADLRTKVMTSIGREWADS
ncbi:hypothetical protein HIM_05576 [Hirsutella minnesotensis 3608]|uniref:ARS-binding protein 2 n=1 Tax=Hirsutella minnesotensis 3608 TaxID=1043627 RepID=A0A0F7ZP91_9HYPO|nr:hypothetical protein HIM_05576 [Hirsutella minnesotensis 3608]